MASQLVQLQQELKARSDELASARAEARQLGVLSTTAKQEAELVRAEMGRLREELTAQASSKAQLQQLLERMHELQARHCMSPGVVCTSMMHEHDARA